ncbi:MAG: SET domain-containing protein, partial [Methanobacteriota archaeon]
DRVAMGDAVASGEDVSATHVGSSSSGAEADAASSGGADAGGESSVLPPAPAQREAREMHTVGDALAPPDGHTFSALHDADALHVVPAVAAASTAALAAATGSVAAPVAGGGAVSTSAAPSSGGAAVGTLAVQDARVAAFVAFKAAGPLSARIVVRRSPIHGWGLFLKRPIPAHAVVIEYTGELIRQPVADLREVCYEEQHRQLQQRASAAPADTCAAAVATGSTAPLLLQSSRNVDQLALLRCPVSSAQSDGSGSCYLFRLDNEWIVDATLDGSAARFINHCCEPNCYSDVITVNGQKRIVIFAMRELETGEEVTYNYKFAIETEAHLKVPCYCGAPRCPGTMN